MGKTSQLPAEGLLQQQLSQRRQRRELLMVEAGEALGFGGEGVERLHEGFLLKGICFSRLATLAGPGTGREGV